MRSRFLIPVVLLLPLAGDAHHSIAAHYDLTRSIALEGVVTEFRFVNPHSFIFIDVGTGPGEPEAWVLQWYDTHLLRKRGYMRELFRPGDELVVSGNPARDGSRRIRVLRLSRPADGFDYELSPEEQFLLPP